MIAGQQHGIIEGRVRKFRPAILARLHGAVNVKMRYHRGQVPGVESRDLFSAPIHGSVRSMENAVRGEQFGQCGLAVRRGNFDVFVGNLSWPRHRVQFDRADNQEEKWTVIYDATVIDGSESPTARTSTEGWNRGVDHGQRLLGKRAFVSGAGTSPDGELVGVGEAIAMLFALQGARVAIGDISRQRADATKERIDKLGGDAIVAIGDLTDEADNARCVQMAVDAFGGLDTLVNNVALSGGGGSPASLSLDTWDQVIRVNLRAPCSLPGTAPPT